MMAALKKEFPGMWTKPGEEFSHNHAMDHAIWTGENSFDKEDLPMFDYYAEDPQENYYVMGVRRPLHEFLEKHGWYAEAHDPGTYFLVPE